MTVRSLEQLYATIKYELVPEDVLSYMVKSGYLEAWTRDVLGDQELANLIGELRGASETELRSRLLETLSKKLTGWGLGVPPSTPEVLCRGTSSTILHDSTSRWIARLSAGGTPNPYSTI